MRVPAAAITLLLACAAHVAAAAPVVWPVNGHAYQVVRVAGGVSWTQANAAAIAAGGHLATLTSAAEDAFVFGLADQAQYWNQEPGGSDLGPWLGGYQTSDNGSTPNANWAWVTGEPWSYTHWHSGEPNNWTGASENYLSFKCYGSSGCRTDAWNDLPDAISELGTAVVSYVVEYEYAAGVGDRPGTGARLLQCAPNPLRGSASVRFEVASRGPVRLSVIDAQGRRVRDLARAEFGPGLHEVAWDGRDERGARVPPGGYFARLEVAGTRRTLALRVVR